MLQKKKQEKKSYSLFLEMECTDFEGRQICLTAA